MHARMKRVKSSDSTAEIYRLVYYPYVCVRMALIIALD
jgi:hypothetical protein